MAKNKPHSLTVMRKTLKVLQKTHDEFEAYGYDIGSYGTCTNRERKTGARCFIGGVRMAAGVLGSPCATNGTDLGDGKELALALELVDKAAENRIKKLAGNIKRRIRKDAKDRSYLQRDVDVEPGRIAEAFGFELNNQYLTFKEQQKKALAVIRSAITKLNKDIEKREAEKG